MKLLSKKKKKRNDENRALRALSIHKAPAISKPAQTATLLSRGEAPEAEIGTRRRASPVALARTWHFGHHNVHSLASGERWKRPGDELGGAARGGCGLGLVVTII